jgi:hypothetical protein
MAAAAQASLVHNAQSVVAEVFRSNGQFADAGQRAAQEMQAGKCPRCQQAGRDE